MTKLIHPLCIIIFFFAFETLHPQSAMSVQSGYIEYERKVDVFSFVHNVSSILKNDEAEDKYKKMNPQFQTDVFSYYFSPDAALYSPTEPYKNGQNEILDFWIQMSGQNSVYTEFEKMLTVSSKAVLGNNYLITDSTQKFKWKLQPEKKEIAGFSCKRADAITSDSTYIIAFFTDLIITEGGPESFNGLPGMILGVIIPSSNVSWYAKKIVPGEILRTKLILPTKGKPFHLSEYKIELQKITDKNPFKELIIENALL
jgi:GLPGLI family protein